MYNVYIQAWKLGTNESKRTLAWVWSFYINFTFILLCRISTPNPAESFFASGRTPHDSRGSKWIAWKKT